MKKIIINVINKLFILGSLVFAFFMIENVSVKAETHVLTSGEVQKEFRGKVVNSFTYSYITKFDSDSNYYYGKEIYDNGVSLANEDFYSGRTITFNCDYYELLILRENITTLYKYNEQTGEFDTYRAFFNSRDIFVLGDGGIYKAEYKYDGTVEHITYIYVDKKVDKITVTPAAYHYNYGVFGTFKFDLVVEDEMELPTTIQYCAGFGLIKDSVDFTKCFWIVRKDEEKNKATWSLTHTVRSEDVGNNQFFFIKVYLGRINDDNIGAEERTTKRFKVNNKMVADVYLVDENGDYLEDKQYYSGTDTIRFLIKFGAPVQHAGLKYQIIAHVADIDDVTVGSVEEIPISYVFEDVSIDEEGTFILNYTEIVHNGNVIELDVVNHFSFAYDGASPTIYINDTSLETVNSSAIGEITVSVTDANFAKMVYYFDKCVSVGSGVCNDTFDNEREVFVSEEATTIITFGEIKEKYNDEEVWLFIRGIDLVGHFIEDKTTSLGLDNTIVPEDDIASLFHITDFYSTNTGPGQYLYIRIPHAYGADDPYISFDGTNYNQCEATKADIIDSTVGYSRCLIAHEYTALNIKVKLNDSMGNEEIHETWFKFSPVEAETVTVDNLSFEIFNDVKEYDALFEIFMSNSILTNDVAFSQLVVSQLEEKLGMKSGASKRLIYLDEDEEISIIATVGNSFDVVKMSELVEKLKNIDKYKNCSLQGSDCSVDLYLRYEYDHDISDFSQIRDVKIAFKDNSNKYLIENFNENVVMEVNTKYDEVKYKLVDSLNLEITETSATKNKKITYTSLNGTTQEVESIDATKLGVYKVVESFVYNNIESFPLTYTVTLKDTTAPVVTLKGGETIKVKKGGGFVDPFVEVSDNYDSEFTVVTSWDKTLNLKEVGEYTVSYWVVDSNGNKSNVVTRQVVVEEVSGDVLDENDDVEKEDVENDDVEKEIEDNKKDNFTTYIIIGGIVLGVIVIITVGILVEKSRRRKKEKKEDF